MLQKVMLQKAWLVIAVVVGSLALRVEAGSLQLAQVVAGTPALAAMKPAAQQVSISAAGNYTLTLTDLGRQAGNGVPFDSLFAVLYQGSKLIKSLALPAGGSTASVSVAALAAGTYQVQVLGATAGGSQYGVALKTSAGVVAWQDSASINGSSDNNTAVQKTLAVTPGQTYSVTVTDRAFPAALAALAFNVSSSGVTQGNCSQLASATCTFTASATSVTLAVLANPGATKMGLYSVRINDGSTDTYADTLPVGDLRVAHALTLPADAGYTLSATDFALPQALTSFSAALVQGANVAALSTSGTATLAGRNAVATLYVVARAASGSSGLYGLSVRSGSATVYDAVEAINPAASGGSIAQQWKIPVTSAGNYTLEVTDFAVPQAVAGKQWSIVQNANILQSGTGSLQAVIPVIAGELQVNVTGNAGGTGEALLGISVRDAAGTVVYASTQGFGERFVSSQLPLVAGKYQVDANDFVVPVALNNLIAIVTRGAELLGRVDANGGSASVPFTVAATAAGDVVVSIYAAPQSANSYGMYGVALNGEPTVSLSASSVSITAGQTVTLTWSSTNANNCTASGGWSGAQGASGSLTTAPLANSTSFVLLCTGPAGQSSQTIQVNVTAGSTGSGGSGGGGAWSQFALLMLGLVCVSRRMLRPAVTKAPVS